MKKLTGILFILVFSINILHALEYQKLVETGNRWNYLIEIPFPIGHGSGQFTKSFFLTNDTIIGNKKYVKLMLDVIEYNKTETNYVGALREDTINQQVFFMNLLNKESLAYSFNHYVGDTLSADSIPRYDDYAYIVRRVRSVDTVYFGGIQRKRVEMYEVVYTTDIANVKHQYETFSDIWYEGIGSLNLLNGYEPLGENRLLCFSHNNELVYDNPEYDSCVYANYHLNDDIKHINIQEGIILYTNPASGLLRVSCSEPIQKIELLDLDGKLLQTTSTNELDVSMLADNIYFIRATTNSARRLIERFVKRPR